MPRFGVASGASDYEQPIVWMWPGGYAKIVEHPGPLQSNGLRIGGGLAMWITQIVLQWTCEPGEKSRVWWLRVTVDTRLPDRFNPSEPVDVTFVQEYTLVEDEKGYFNTMVGESKDEWVANRVYMTLDYMVRHELKESVLLGTKFLHDAHAKE